MQRLFRLIRVLLAAGASTLLPTICLAQAYGTGGYNTQGYGSSTVTLPLVGTLPATGAIAGLIAILALSASVYLMVWARIRRRRRAAEVVDISE